jgi:hypothetical protein
MGDLRLGTTNAGLVKSHPLRAFGETPLGALSPKMGELWVNSFGEWAPFMLIQ